MRKRRLVLAELRAHFEWIDEWTPDKGRYVWFEGSRPEKRDLRQKLKYPPQPYQKRANQTGRSKTHRGDLCSF